MRFVHTSDWHLGHTLISKDRKIEHQRFLNWLETYLNENQIPTLIVSGDVFDSGLPPNYALKMYYDFLVNLQNTSCSTVIIIAGNHDSPSLIEAPKALLKHLNVHVIGQVQDKQNRHIISINDQEGSLKGIICALPFLRDRELRFSVSGESSEERAKAIVKGIEKQYEKSIEIAQSIIKTANCVYHLPIIATGHLFATGGNRSDGIREIHVGSLGHVPVSAFSENFDYVALGHLHKSQLVANRNNVRYSGAPIPLSFGEACQKKSILDVNIRDKQTIEIKEIDIPRFQQLQLIEGNLESVISQINSLKETSNKDLWVEVLLKTEQRIPDVQETLIQLTEKTPIEILSVRYANVHENSGLSSNDKEVQLSSLTPDEIFNRKLDQSSFEDEQTRETMRKLYNEVLSQVLMSQE